MAALPLVRNPLGPPDALALTTALLAAPSIADEERASLEYGLPVTTGRAVALAVACAAPADPDDLAVRRLMARDETFLALRTAIDEKLYDYGRSDVPAIRRLISRHIAGLVDQVGERAARLGFAAARTAADLAALAA